MSSRKKSTSTTESSSGSTSGTSSSSESSSGSDSNSSSSDSESTTSQEQEPTRRSSSGSTNNHQEAKTVTGSTGPATATGKKPPRRASDTRPQNKSEPTEKLSTSASNKGKAIAAATKAQQQRSRQVYANSSDDDGPPAKTQVPATKRTPNDTKKKPVQSNKSKANPVPPVTGGKAPPAVVKQQQQQLQNLNKNLANKNGGAAATKAAQKAASKNVDSKDKSIFSPDNTTESEEDVKTKSVKTPAPKPKPPPRPKGRPPKNKVVEKPPVVKSSAESSTTASTSDSTSTSESESESSVDSSPLSKKVAEKKPADKTNTSAVKSEVKDPANSESDIENKATSNVVRKLTRSSSTRKSKHLTAIFNPGKASDSDSEADSKRSLSKSPVKRAPATKGKSKNSKSNAKNNTSPNKKTSAIPEERRCPVDGCDSVGHLGGRLEKHFTQEACPLYHNMTLADTKAWALEREQREEERKKAHILYEPSKKQYTVDQKAYQIKVKEIRNKFKPPLTSPTRPTHTNAHFHNAKDTEREPSLTGLVSDYDLQLFREAQARSSEKIEEELKDIQTGKGTKYIIMGRHKMEVWYQSPYPDDAARLPKLYLCEFCLQYQKCEIGMKRHAAKCVWRHPPGDEIYRKGKLGVWQVDGKRQKQYCQHLCLLAKFFLDHKTLYYDVEPFLFYIMTLADSEGCHTVGYFSKEKNSFLNYNVSCILTLPPYQRKGFGRLLIDFSYLLTRVEGKIGSPEKPLSDLGLISYRSYWKDVLLDYLCNRTGTTLSIKDVSQEMAINSYDIVSTLQALGMMKYWKGKHIILKKQDVIEEYEERVKSRGMVLKIDSSCLRWTPFVPAAPLGPS
ncbi:hypothetical protein HA402_010965 [Bradysia odoriphaga]|nr:hypothetical protein HA402_010965 [Bradysia odoriphaga]